MRNPRMLFVLVIAIGCGLGASLLVAKYVQGQQQEVKKVKVWRVKKDKTVTAYSPLNKDAFDAKEMEEKDSDGWVIGDDGLEGLIKDKKMLKVSLGESKPLLLSDIYDPIKDNLRGSLKPGEIATTIPVTTETNVAGFVQPGFRVDISAVTSMNTGTGTAPYSQLILQNIEVLATNEQTAPSADAPARPASTVTLRLTREQALLLNSYQQGGATLKLFLRPVNDKDIYNTPGRMQAGVSREVYTTNAPDEALVANPTSGAVPPPPIMVPTIPDAPPAATTTAAAPDPKPVTQPTVVAAAPKKDTQWTIRIIDDGRTVKTQTYKNIEDEANKGGTRFP